MKDGTTKQSAPKKQAKENVASKGEYKKIVMGSKIVKKTKLDDKRRNNYGHKGSGRKPNAMRQTAIDNADIVEEIEKHLNEEVEVRITNRITGKIVIEKRKTYRVLLDTLRDAGITNKNVPAIREYFDRTLDRLLGKTAQSIALKHSGEVGTYKSKRPTRAALAAKKAYADNLED